MKLILIAAGALLLGLIVGIVDYRMLVARSIVEVGRTPPREFPILVVGDAPPNDITASVVQYGELPNYLAELGTYAFSVPAGKERAVADLLAQQTAEIARQVHVDPLRVMSATIEASDAAGQTIRTQLKWQSGRELTGWYQASGKRMAFVQFQDIVRARVARGALLAGVLAALLVLVVGEVVLIVRKEKGFLATWRTR